MDSFRVRRGTNRLGQKKPYILIEELQNGAIVRQFHMNKAEARQLANDIIGLIDALDAPTPEVLSVISK